MKEQLNILIVEDDAIIAQLLELYVHKAGHHVIDVIHNSEEALDKIYTHQPDMILLDIHILGTKDGIEVGNIVNEKYSIPIIFITALADKDTILRAKNVKPSGYIIKPFKAEEIYSAITIGYYNFQVRNCQTEITKEHLDSRALSPLTNKEYQLLLDIANGFTNEQIAQRKSLSLNTIKWHSQNIYSKLGVRNRTAAAKIVMQV